MYERIQILYKRKQVRIEKNNNFFNQLEIK